jgi:hypothetical protein
MGVFGEMLAVRGLAFMTKGNKTKVFLQCRFKVKTSQR